MTISPNTPTVESISSPNDFLEQISPEQDVNLVNDEIRRYVFNISGLGVTCQQVGKNLQKASLLLKVNFVGTLRYTPFFSSSEFATLADDVLENTIFNLIWEANLGEVNLTTRPRVIALPPSRGKTNL